MPVYNYICDVCSKAYSEKRSEYDPQLFTKCECSGTYIENND
jgi:predicted nucleic acid-binding Zn ribbon protein